MRRAPHKPAQFVDPQIRSRSRRLRFKRVIGDGLRSRTDERRATEMDVAVQVLNRMLELGRPESVRIA